MWIWPLLAQASTHPTDSLPVSKSEQSGLQVIIGGDVDGNLSGSLIETGTTHRLEFLDNGKKLDVQLGDNVWVAHVKVTQKGGEAPLLLQMGKNTLWDEPIPIGSERSQLFLKILIKQGRPIVKVDTFDTDAPPPEEAEIEAPPPPIENTTANNTPTADKTSSTNQNQSNTDASTASAPPPPQASKPSAPFYESSVFLNTLSSLLFLGLGFIAGDRFRKMTPPQPLRWFYLGNGKASDHPAQHLIVGQRQCWSCSEDLDRHLLLSLLIKGLEGAGPILVLADPKRQGRIIQEHMGQPGLFVSTEVPCSLKEVEAQVKQLIRIGNPIVIIDGSESLEPAQANETQNSVVQDALYWLPEGTSVLALVSERYNGIIQHHLTSVDWPEPTQNPSHQS
ncbi:MAG: hypothetical protein VXZ96_05615 [Myxococcota bacterium]|nr:hypothetical protein [Myxococcota bacterium]